MPKKEILICIKNPFSQRDYSRMGIHKMQQIFNVKILDLTAWLLPVALKTRETTFNDKKLNIKKCTSFRDVLINLSAQKNCLALDFCGLFSPKSALFFWFLKKIHIPYVVIDSGAHPVFLKQIKSSFAKKFTDWLKRDFAANVSQIILRLVLIIFGKNKPDLALVSGTSWKKNPRFLSAKNKYNAHSFDFEMAIQQKHKKIMRKPYIVYLDEKITSHEDNYELHADHPATDLLFWPALQNLFLKFEASLNMEIVIAGYPSSQKNDQKHKFKKRKIFTGCTSHLVQHASLVLAHGTTAVSFAAIFYKPVIFITSNEIMRSWYQPTIDALREALDSPMVNIDQNVLVESIQTKINKKAYTHFIKTFITLSPNSRITIWKKLDQAVKKYLPDL